MEQYYFTQVTPGAIITLRWKQLRQGLPRETAVFPGDDADRVVHYAAFQSEFDSHKADTAICCLTLLPGNVLDENVSYQLRGMATDEAYQGKGIGAALLKYSIDDITKKTGAKEFWCNARESAVGFYNKSGWKVTSEKFEIEGVGPHYKMHYLYE